MPVSLDVPFVVNDCSPVPVSSVTPDVDNWLREVARLARPAQLVVGLSPDDGRDYDPVLWFDQSSSRWWAGRYVGEVNYQGRTLRIQPRFGMPALCRWLSRIYGIQLIASSGDYASQSFLLWELIAHLWASRLVSAARHGLPHRRVGEVHRGTFIRGRLMLRESLKSISTGSGLLASVTRERRVDAVIGGIILAAFERMESALGKRKARIWLTERGNDIVEDIFAGGIKPHYDPRSPVRYTPITESYRPLVELSVSIIQQRPLASSISGEKEVSGVLLDIAEIWELYLFNVIRDGMQSLDVVHGTRDEDARFLLRGASGRSLQRIKPDILLLDPFAKIVVGMLDAKYKNASPSREVPGGVLREDLYQATAYLSALGPAHSPVSGFLAYPVGQDWLGPSMSENPWTLNSSANRTLSFLGVPVEPLADTDRQIIDEQDLVATLQRTLASSLSLAVFA